MCLAVTPEIQKLADQIIKKYPEQCQKIGFDANMCAEAVGRYNKSNNKQPDFVPDADSLVNYIEKTFNMEGKSLLYTPYSITYTPKGKNRQTYTIIGKNIFNKDGKVVFSEDSKDRRRIFANLAVQQGRAVVVDYKDKQYVVNNRNQIISVQTGDEMKWGEENGDRKEILRLSQIAFEEKQKAETATTNPTVATDGESTINPEESRLFEEENNEIEQIVTVAPYFRNHLTSKNKEQLEKATEKAKEDAQKLASAMGLQIEAVEVVGGTYQGNSEITYQYRMKSSDQELVDLFAALMGDLSIEYQDAVIAANYTKDKSQITAYELTWKAPEGTTIEKIEELLKSLGIEGSTYHFDNGKLDITAFSEGETKEIINKLKNTDYEFEEYNGQNSRYLDNEYRRNAYRSWLNSKRGEQNRKLNNACQKALAICDAAAQYPDVEDKENHPQEQEAQEQKRLAAAQEAAANWQSNPVLDQFKKDIDLLAGYYEGGGRVLSDDLPSITHELDDRLNNYFMGGVELSIDDYRNLWKLIEFYDDNGERRFRERKSSSSPSQAAPIPTVPNNNLSESAVGLGLPVQKEIQRPKSVAFESALRQEGNERLKKYHQTFSSQQIKDRGAMISDVFSGIVDDLVADGIDECLEIINDGNATDREKNEARQKLSSLRDPVKGRQFAAEERGIESIISEIKDSIRNSMEFDIAYNEGKKRVLYENTLEFFKELFEEQATLDIENREGIRIVNDKVANQTVSEDDNEDNENGDDEVGNVATGSDGWNFKVRFTDPASTLSKKVKSMLYEVERPESEKDDLGNVRKYPMGYVYASFLSYIPKHVETADDFMRVIKDFRQLPDEVFEKIADLDEAKFNYLYPNGYPVFTALEQMRVQYPWVNQVISRLTDDYLNPEYVGDSNLRYPPTGGAMASQFYTNFKNAYIPYAKIKDKNGEVSIIPLNYEMEDRAQRDKLIANYNNRMVFTDHSIYDASGKIDRENAKWLKGRILDVIDDVRAGTYTNYPELIALGEQNPQDAVLNKDDINEYDDFISSIREILQSYGIDASQDNVVTYLMMHNGAVLSEMLNNLSFIADIISNVEDDRVDTFDYILDTKDKYGTKQWEHFFDGKGLITDESYIQSFYDSASKKTKYSYSADNYLMKQFRGIAKGTLEERRAYIDEHFGKYEWFREQKQPKERGWRNAWLEFWYNYPGNEFEIPYRNIDNVTEVSEITRIRPYSKWDTGDVWNVQNQSYNPESKNPMAYYLAPIFADSPMSMTVKGPKLSMQQLLYGYNDSQGRHQQGALVKLVSQELWRIQLVQDRKEEIKKGNIQPIANFDGERGMSFCFMPELNNYVFKDTGEKFLDRIVRLKKETETSSTIEKAQIQAIKDVLDMKMGQYVAENISEYQNNNQEYKDLSLLEEQYYNMVYANAAIVQITTIDTAYYKDDTDFQKRFKEVYSGGKELNTNSKYGKKTENVLLLADDEITSPSYDKIAAIIDASENLTDDDKTRIKGLYTEINVADAQAIRSMHSFRSVFDMMGRWDARMEEALQHFRDNDWRIEDFDVIFQTIKPFVYTVIERNDGKGGMMPVPQQHKNSEICALMMYDLITNGLDNSPAYKALSRFMEKTVGADGNPLIDMIQYESAGKVGNQGVINISFNPDKIVAVINNGVVIDGKEYTFYTAYKDGKYISNTVDNAKDNYKAIKATLDEELYRNEISQNDYNKIMGYIRPNEEEIISILEKTALVNNPDGTRSINPEYVHTIPFANYYQQQPTPEHHIDAESVYGSQARNIAVADLPTDFSLTLSGKNGSKTFKGSDAIVDFYYELNNENLLEDFFGNGGKKGLKGLFSSKESLREAVEEIVRGNPKYGRDFADALKIDGNGNFVLSPNSPTIFPLMQEIITSFFKNRITKQTINGAALIQAAGIGLDDTLRIKFDKNGKLLGAECYMPLTSKKLFEPLLETKIINGKEVRVLNPEKLHQAGIDEAVGYRIPTENKSSMMPLIIKGFTPQQNGSAIILPAEITTIAGSDFDVDKMYVLLSSFTVQEYNMENARRHYAMENATYADWLSKFPNSELAEKLLDSEPESFKEWFKRNKDDYRLSEPIIRKIKYDFSKTPKENGREARNNMLVQMMYGILTSKEGSESFFNPQGFPDVENAAKITKILTTDSLRKALISMSGNIENAIDYLQNTETKLLEKFISSHSIGDSPIYPQTFAHFHEKNMAGYNQIGIYAIQASMCAKYQRAITKLKEEHQFNLNGRTIADVDVSDNGKRLKNVGQMVGASADNGKKPNLTDMGSTQKTAPIIGYMLRAGLTHLEAALIINQPAMKMYNYNPAKLKQAMFGFTNPLYAKTGEVTTEMLMRNIAGEATAEDETAIAAVCYKILKQAEAQQYLRNISRFDSPNGAMKNSFAKARVQQYNVDLFQAKMGQPDFPFVRINDALSNDNVDTSSPEESLREQLNSKSMGLLQGMYHLGVHSFNDLVSPYFFGAEKWFDDKILKPILYNINYNVADSSKEDIVDKLYKSYITYTLSSSPLFGNEESASMKEKRDYYLNQFPLDYLKVIRENKDIRDSLSSILQVEQFGSRRRITLKDVGSLGKGQKAEVQRRFEELLYNPNPEAQKLAKDLFIYSYFDNGLQFTHDSFSHLFTTTFITDFPAYTETLNELNIEAAEESQKNFIAQFLVTYPEAAYNVDRILDGSEVQSDGSIVIDFNDKKYLNGKKNKFVNEVLSPNPQFSGTSIYPYISYAGDVYILDEEALSQNPSHPKYDKVNRYATDSKLPLFSSQLSVTELAQQFPWGATSTDDAAAEESREDDFVDHNESNEDSALESDMFDIPDDFDNFELPEDVTPDAPQSKSDAYSNEGKGELQTPFCNS